MTPEGKPSAVRADGLDLQPAIEPRSLLAFLLGPEHRSILDVEGRPLGEQASPQYRPEPGDESVRKFGDQRDATGLPCNLAALRQLRDCWGPMLGMLASFGSELDATAYRAMRRAHAGTWLAPLLYVRTGQPPPRETAALYKVTLGFSELLPTLLMEQTLDADAPLPSAESLDDWLDERPWLVGDAQVCAGTRKQIRRAYEALGDTGQSVETHAAWEASWFHDAVDACLELEAILAVVAVVGRGLLLHGRATKSFAANLFQAPSVPRIVEAARRTPGATALHPSLLFPAEEVPASLRAFIDAVSQEPSQVDDLLLQHLEPVSDRIAAAVGCKGEKLALDDLRLD